MRQSKAKNSKLPLASRTPRSASAKRPRKGNLAGRPTADELERRKLRVMEVATELFIERGYAATSFVDIAKDAGVATRTLYQHFGDKEALFRDVIFARDTGAIIPPPKLEANDTLYLALDRTARYACNIALRPRSVDLMRLMVAESKRFPDLMRKVATATFSRFRGNVSHIFEDLERCSLLPEGNHSRSAELFIDLVQGERPIMTYLNWVVTAPSDEDLNERIEMFILGRFGPVIARRARTKVLKAKDLHQIASGE